MALLTQLRLSRLARLVRRSYLVCLAVAVGLSVASGAELSAEYRIKAGFLFNFPQFVDWPARVFRDAKAPLVIGVLGDDPFGPYLDELVQGEKIGNRPLVVQRFHRVEEVDGCQILFVSHSENAHFDQLLAALRGRGVLTIGEDEGFERAGGMVRFAIENKKVRLRINPEAAKTEALTISSKLLRLATLVSPPKG